MDQLREALIGLGLTGRKILVGVSGGADSVALLLGLVELRDDLNLNLLVDHLDHGLREGSEDEGYWVAKLCHTLDVDCVLGWCDVFDYQARNGGTLEESARVVRYSYFQKSAKDYECTAIAVAHTADDQAETVLHHIIRGTGLRGLRGIPVERMLSPELRIVRPLLGVRRTEIEAWLAERGQRYREDETNHDPAFTRNRIRNQLLPSLEADYNPQVVGALTRLGEQAGELEAALDELAEIYLSSAVIAREPTRCVLDPAPLSRLPDAVRRVCLTLLWQQQNWPRKRMTHSHWKDVSELFQKKRGAIDLPAGITVRKRKEGLIVEWATKET